jgi:hypothetical protein
MTIAATAISFILLATGLATCGWRFLQASREPSQPSSLAQTAIGRLIVSVFLLAAGYNAVLGFGSLASISNPNILVWTLVLSNILLTGLALLSVYTIYYIFWPDTSPKGLLTAVSATGGVGLFHINTPLQLAPLLAANLSPGALLTNSTLLTISLAATTFLFVQLFRRADSRSIRNLSLIVCGLTVASILHAGTQLFSPQLGITGATLGGLEIFFSTIGLSLLLTMISSPAIRGAIGIFVALSGWRLIIHFSSESAAINNPTAWAFACQLLAIWALYYGIVLTKRNGGTKTLIGKVLMLFTFGLILQIFGHNFYYLYNFFAGVEIPYPAWSEVGYFGTNVLYIFAAIYLCIYFQLNQFFKSAKGKICTIGIPTFLLLSSYLLILRNFNPDWNEQFIKSFLDMGYTLMSALYLSLGILAYVASRQLTNPALRHSALLVMIALAAQYAADNSFTIQNNLGNWANGAGGDYFYFVAYFLIAIALIKLGKQGCAPKIIHQNLASKFSPIKPISLGSKSVYGLYGAVALFATLLGWWTVLYFKFGGQTKYIETAVWPDVYNLLAIWGVWWGFKASQRLGGFKNALGQATGLFTIGLLFQVFGQIAFSVYINFFGVEIPYPSLADIAFLGSPIIYLIALIPLGKALGTSYDIKKAPGTYWTLFSLLGILFFSGLAIGLGQNYVFDWNEPLRIVLDLAYPFVETLCLVVFLYICLNQNKPSPVAKILPLMGAALAMQYASDTLFTYLTANNLWDGGSPSELAYLTAYLLMTLTLIRLGKPKDEISAPVSPRRRSSTIFILPLTQAIPRKGTSPNVFAETLRRLTEIRSNNSKEITGDPRLEKPRMASISKYK